MGDDALVGESSGARPVRFDYVRRVPGSGWRRANGQEEVDGDGRRRRDWVAWGRMHGRREGIIRVVDATEIEAHRVLRAACTAYTAPVSADVKGHLEGSDLRVPLESLGDRLG